MSRDRARFIVERYGTDSLSYFALRDDKEWFGFRDTLVAYRVHNGIALGVARPRSVPVGQRAEAWAAFREFADEHGWPVAVMGACADWLPVYRASGMHDLYIGDEAVVDVRRFSLDGKQNKSLRQSVGRVEKSGLPRRVLRSRAARRRARERAAGADDREPARRRRARVLDDARPRVRGRRPRSAARGRVRRRRQRRRASASSFPRGRSTAGRSTSCAARSRARFPTA